MLAVLIIITACQSKTKTSSNDADAIRSLEEHWTEANKTKDIDKIVSFFASDAVVMEPNKPISIGLQSIRKSQESWFADTTVHYNTYTSIISNIEVSASGDLAYARGISRLSRDIPSGSTEEVDNWIDIWKKIDGEWKVLVNIWNIENPLEGK